MEKSNTFYLTILYKEFFYDTERILKEKGVNYGQLPFILYIGNHEGCTPSDIKNTLRMDWGHVQRSIDRLERDGLLLKEYDEKKSRTYYLKLTKLGEDAFEISHHVFFSWDDKLKSCLGKEEWEELSKILQHLVNTRKERWKSERI